MTLIVNATYDKIVNTLHCYIKITFTERNQSLFYLLLKNCLIVVLTYNEVVPSGKVCPISVSHLECRVLRGEIAGLLPIPNIPIPS